MRATRLFSIAALIVAIALAGAALAHFSMNVHPRFHTLPLAVDSQRAILDRELFHFDDTVLDHSWRNRVAVPITIRALTKVTHATFSQAYIVVRWLTASAALAAFGWLVVRTLKVSVWTAAAAAALFGLSLLPTFLHIYEIPSDFLDAAFFSLLVLCVLERRRVAFALLLLVALLNREAAIFATFAWFAVHAWPFARERFLRETAFCFVLGVAGTALVVGVRLANAAVARPGVQAVFQRDTPAELAPVHLRMLRDFFHHPTFASPLFFLFGYFALLALLWGAYRDRLPRPWKRLGLAGVGIYLISVCNGNIDELRIYIPSLVISTLLLAAVATSAPAAQPNS